MNLGVNGSFSLSALIIRIHASVIQLRIINRLELQAFKQMNGIK